MKWTDAEDIAIALAEKFPGVDPLTLRFTWEVPAFEQLLRNSIQWGVGAA